MTNTNNTINKEAMKAEAISRMKKLHLSSDAINAFENGNVWVSETSGLIRGALFEANDEQKKLINDFEEQYNAMVYHCILSYTNFGVIFNMLYVSKYTEEWAMDNEDIDEGYAVVMAKNLTDDFCSDIGSIAIRMINGGLERTM